MIKWYQECSLDDLISRDRDVLQGTNNRVRGRGGDEMAVEMFSCDPGGGNLIIIASARIRVAPLSDVIRITMMQNTVN